MTPSKPDMPRFAKWAEPWRATLLLVLGVLVLRLLYLWLWCPYPLIEDEAHYWEWSRRLDWSYYSKGPGVAWVIWCSTQLLGATEVGVRAPAAICGAIAALCTAGLARDVTRSGRAAFFAAACFTLIPVFQASSLLMTIDMPYCACWALAAWAGWRAAAMGSRRAWVVLGAAIGAGIIFKYTMLLFVPGFAIALWWMARRRAIAQKVPVAFVGLGVCAALLGLLPIVIWNAQNGWPTVHHLLGHLGVKGGDMPVVQGNNSGWHYSPRWTLEFIGLQVLLIGPALALAIHALRSRGADGVRMVTAQPGRVYLLLLALPLMVFYIGVTFVAEAEANWAVASFVTLAALAGCGVVEGMDEHASRRAAWLAIPAAQRPRAGILRRSPESAPQIAWHWTIGVGVVTALVLTQLYGIAKLPWIGPKVPMTRISGAAEMAADAQRRIEALRGAGEDPFVMTQLYGRASQLAFYMPGHPVVYAASPQTGGRKTQYDMWKGADALNTNVDDPRLLGRAALLVGATAEQWQTAFARVERAEKLAGDLKRGREVFVGYGYRGFGAAVAAGGGAP